MFAAISIEGTSGGIRLHQLWNPLNGMQSISIHQQPDEEGDSVDGSSRDP